MKPFAWTAAQSVAQACSSGSVTVAQIMVDRGNKSQAPSAAVLKAGGIDLLDLMKRDLLTPQRLVNLRDIPGLDRVTAENGAVRIGAMVTLAQLARHPLIRDCYGALAAAAGTAASPQIREMASIGGNLLQRPRCWYFRSADHFCARKGGSSCFAFAGDNRYHAIFNQHGCAMVHPSTPATALVAFGASVELARADGTKRVVELERFFVPPETDIRRENTIVPGEVLTAVLLPVNVAGVRSAYLRQMEKNSFDWPIADVAVVLELDAERTCRQACVVLGAAAPVPHRASAAEQTLRGQKITEESAARAAQAALAGATPLAQNAYKVQLFEPLVRRAILAA